MVCGDIDVENNCNGLAELAGFSYLAIRNLMRARSPTMELLDQWTTQENVTNATVGELWNFLFVMERFDVLTDCKSNILNDCRIYEEQMEIEREAHRREIENRDQDPTVSNSDMSHDENMIVSIQDVYNNDTGVSAEHYSRGDASTQAMFDAFVCYTQSPEDLMFVKRMITELEEKQGLKLFVPGRDDLPGGAMHVITAYLIEVRCKRVVIVLSEAFLHSAICDFQVKFATALAPGARSKKLIPVIRERSIRIPRILRFLSNCDFTREDMEAWAWERLAMAIKAPFVLLQNPESTDSKCALQDIRFPSATSVSGQSSHPPSRQSSCPTPTHPSAQQSSSPAPACPPQRTTSSPTLAQRQTISPQTQASHAFNSTQSGAPGRRSSPHASRDYRSIQTEPPVTGDGVSQLSLQPVSFASRGRGVPKESTYPQPQPIDSPDDASFQSLGFESDSTDITSTVHYV